MGVLDWLLGRSPDIDSPAPHIEPPAAHRHVPPPDPAIDIDERVIPATAVDEIELDEVFAAIEYEDAKGNQSRRRITIQRLNRGPNAPILNAICHERHAIRHFRTDRITCFITTDGEVIDTDAFFRDVLGIDLGTLRPDQTQHKAKYVRSSQFGPNQTLQVAKYVRERLRAPLSILVAAAQCDGEFHPEELDVIERFAEDHIEWLELNGRLVHGDDQQPVSVGIDELDHLNGMIASMRPQRRSLDGYLSRIMEFEDKPFKRFLRSLEAVIAADGRLDPEEVDFIQEISDIRHPKTGEHLSFDGSEV